MLFDVYTGKDSSQDSKAGLGARAICSLMMDLKARDMQFVQTIFKYRIFESLRLKTIGASVRASRRELPADMRICKLQCGDLRVMWENHD